MILSLLCTVSVAVDASPPGYYGEAFSPRGSVGQASPVRLVFEKVQELNNRIADLELQVADKDKEVGRKETDILDLTKARNRLDEQYQEIEKDLNAIIDNHAKVLVDGQARSVKLQEVAQKLESLSSLLADSKCHIVVQKEGEEPVDRIDQLSQLIQLLSDPNVKASRLMPSERVMVKRQATRAKIVAGLPSKMPNNGGSE